jgi:hypothetical protein
MSLAVETFNIEGWVIDGTSTQLTVRVADRQGNAVEDGTVVNFTAEGGQVARSCATTPVFRGFPSAAWPSRARIPVRQGGRASVLAYLEGTKDYVDVNGNNRYDAGLDTLAQPRRRLSGRQRKRRLRLRLHGEFLIPRGGVRRVRRNG